MYKVVSSLSRASVDCCPLYFSRVTMASGRNHYVKRGSNKQDISPETKKMIRDARDPDDHSWQLGHGIREPLEMDLTTEEKTRATQYKVKYHGHRVMGGEDKVKYFPHEGEQIPEEQPSPVLMVTKVKSEFGEPYWIKDYLRQIGLGRGVDVGKICFLPNIPSVGMLLYRMKHIIKIRQLKFPNGIPDNFSPDTHGYKLNAITGEFTITDIPNESTESIAARADWMKLDSQMITKHHRKEWDRPWGTPLGNHNYYKDNSWIDNAKAASQYEKNKPKNKKWS